MKNDNAIVIGAGIGGLAAAARLASKGFRVEVFEKNECAGGKMGLLEQDGYTFDTGPSLFTQPYILEALFRDCGCELSDFLTYRPLEVNTSYFYDDGTQIIAYKNKERLANEIATKLSISPQPLLQFLDEAKQLYENIGTIFLDEPIHQLKTWTTRRIPKALATLKWQYLFQSMHAYHRDKLKHPKLVQLFDRFATYNGSNPYKAPAMLCMIAHLEMNEGAYYAEGGMIRIANVLHELCTRLGVSFQFNTLVKKITTSAYRVTGIETKNEIHASNIVVSNADVYFTYKNLLGDASLSNKLERQQRSSSALIFFWGVRSTFPELHLHNIFFSDDYKTEFDVIFDTDKISETDPTVYVNITNKEDNIHAPEGCENWFVLINTPAASASQDEDWIRKIRAAVIKKLNRILCKEIEPLIATESVLTPAMIASNTGSYLGALYGTASNGQMSAFMRHANQSAKYQGLYFAGGSVHPGGGIPLCLRSANLAVEAITSHYRS